MKKVLALVTFLAILIVSVAASAEGMIAPILIDEPEVMGTFGPNGEAPVWYDQVVLTEDEVNEIRGMNLKIALEGSNESEWATAQFNGFKAAAELLGMTVVAETTCEVDPSIQKQNMETFAALDIDGLVDRRRSFIWGGDRMVQNAFELRDICMSFNGVEVLKHVDFTLRQGEIMGLIGKNGAGSPRF